MARIRTVKPEFWQHPKVTRVSRDARLLFLGLLNEADDEGKLRYGGKRLAGVLFGEDDDVSGREIDAWTAELERAHLVVRYEVDGAPLLLVPGFLEHQNINRPSKSRLPNPHGGFTEPSVSPPGTVPEASLGEQGTGNREQGMEQGGHSLALVVEALPQPDPHRLVFDEWRLAARKPNATLDQKRRDSITKALKTFPLDDVLDAVRGVRLSEFHQGNNDRNKRFVELDLILRDARHIEDFRDLHRGNDPPPVKAPKGFDAVERAVRRAEGGTT